MKGKLYIDGKDAFDRYGVFVEQYGYKTLVQVPAFKSIESTEWPEYDGEDYDLSAPVLDSKEFSVPFCIIDVWLAGDLFKILSDKSYHEFQFVDLGKTYKLRLVNNGSLSSKIKLGKLSLNFADDFPEIPEETPYAKKAEDVRQSGYELDGIDFSRFGVYVVNGADNNIQKAPKVRANLTIDTKTLPGIDYDDENVTYEAKDVTLPLLIRAKDISIFWERWNSLFTVLVKPEERVLYVDNTAEDYKCFYKKNTVSKFEILRNGRVWCEFSIILTFTDSRPTGLYETLATELGELVITEDNEECYINLNRYAD